jgi:hypothetical protein
MNIKLILLLHQNFENSLSDIENITYLINKTMKENYSEIEVKEAANDLIRMNEIIGYGLYNVFGIYINLR